MWGYLRMNTKTAHTNRKRSNMERTDWRIRFPAMRSSEETVCMAQMVSSFCNSAVKEG